MSGEAVYISSRQNPYVMRVASLSDNKGRAREGLFKFGGFKLFSEAVACGLDIERVILREDVAKKLEGEVRRVMPNADICVFSEYAFDKVSDEKSPEGIITVAKHIDKITKIATIDNIANLLPMDSTVIALESLRDPGNLGTILRSAAAFGVDRVILSADCAELYNPRTLRAAMGAAFKLPTVRVDDLPAALTAAGYERCAQIEGPGQFAVRGGIVDVYAAQNAADEKSGGVFLTLLRIPAGFHGNEISSDIQLL